MSLPDPPAQPASERPVKLAALVGMALVSATILFCEIAFTRYFSFRLWYHYAFMIISIALLGLGASSTLLALSRSWLERFAKESVLATTATLFGITLALALLALDGLNERFVSRLERSPGEAFFLMAAYWGVLFVPFFFGGATLSWFLHTFARQIATVYAFDLAGAGLGALAVGYTLYHLHPGQAVLAASLAALAAGLLFALSRGRLPGRALAALWLSGLALVVVSLLVPGGIEGGRITPSKGLALDLRTGGRVVATRPNTNGRVDVVEKPTTRFVWGIGKNFSGDMPEQLLMRIDGDALTAITRYDPAQPASWRFTDYIPGTLPYHVAAPERVLVIGPGGGMDVVNALERGVSRVVGVEINRRVIELVSGRFAEFSGGVYLDPRVRIEHSDGRNFVEWTKERFDLIQLTLVDTFAAISSGALSLSEDFLYTTEAFRAYLRALDDDGLLCLGRTDSEAISIAVLVHAATRGQGVALARHVFVADAPPSRQGMTFLYKKTPFTAEEIARGVEFVETAGLRLVHAPGLASSTASPLAEFLATGEEDRERLIGESATDITPETDDRPFYFRSSKWSDLLGTYRGGRGNLLLILAVATVFSLLLIVVPLVVTSREAVSGNAPLLAYFVCIGLAFIILEIGLITKFVLFLGHPVRSLTVTLFSLLLFAGLGSASARRLLAGAASSPWRKSVWPRAASSHHFGRSRSGEPDRSPRGGRAPAPRWPLAVLAGLILLYWLVLDRLLSLFMGWSLPLRVAMAVALLAPLALVMGMALPLGMNLLAARRRELVLWAWGLNGVASVVGSVACVILAHAAGFGSTFAAAAACYLLAMLLFGRVAATALDGAPISGPASGATSSS